MILSCYYESMERELKIRPIHACRCDERLKTKAQPKAEESKRLATEGKALLFYFSFPACHRYDGRRDSIRQHTSA